MQIALSPYKQGDKGIAMLPLARNVKKPKDDWKLVRCPKCNVSCYESEQARMIASDEIEVMCTQCALKLTFGK